MPTFRNSLQQYQDALDEVLENVNREPTDEIDAAESDRHRGDPWTDIRVDQGAESSSARGETSGMQSDEGWRRSLNDRLANLINQNMRHMENDETTPPCLLCDARHTGILSPSYLLLRGNYVFDTEHGMQIFVFDDELKIEFIKTMSGRKACVVDVAPGQLASAVVHDDCAQEIYKKKEVLAGFEMYPTDDEDVEEMHAEHHKRLVEY